MPIYKFKIATNVFPVMLSFMKILKFDNDIILIQLTERYFNNDFTIK